MKTRFLILALLSIVGLESNSPAADSNPQPNIIVFLVDDMGVMDTSVPFLTDKAGKPRRYPLNDHYRTPNMARIASSGIRFNNFYAMSVCSPTRISIMTGQNAARHRSTNWINPERDNAGPKGPAAWNWSGISASAVTLPKLLRTAGYRTIHIGKGHFGPMKSVAEEPLNLGFSFNVGGCSIGAPGSYFGSKNYGFGGKRAARAVPHLENYHGSDTFLTEALTIEAKAQVTRANEAGEPFFLYMSHYAVHAPFNSDPRFAKNYTESGKPQSAQAFATLIEGMDKSLGDLLTHVNDLGVAENTLILFLGDNGSDAPLGHEHAVACAAPLRGKKGAHYEGGMRVPFIATWAKSNDNNVHQKRLPIPAGVIQPQVANVTDIFPTLLALLDQPKPDSHKLDGNSMLALLRGKSDPSRPEQFLMHYPHSPHRSQYFSLLRDGDWKVIYHYFDDTKGSEGSHYQLYNLATDPFESSNVAATEPVVLKRMLATLDSQLRDHDAVYPVAAAGSTDELRPILP